FGPGRDGYCEIMTNRRSGDRKSDEGGGTPKTPIESQHELLGLFIEHVRDYAIFTLDPEGHVTSWNAGAARIKGYKADELIDKPVSIFYTPEDRARGWPAEVMRRATIEGRAEDQGMRMRKDGTRFWARIVLSAVRDDDGKLLGFTKVTQDISDQRRAEL